LLKFSLGVPKKTPVRLDRFPTVEDFQQIAKKAELDGGKDNGIAWVAYGVEFKLFVRYEAPRLLWRMWNSTVPENTPPWLSNEKNPRIAHKQVESVCREFQSSKPSRPESMESIPAISPTKAGPSVAEGTDRLIDSLANPPSPVEGRILLSLATNSFEAPEERGSAVSRKMTGAFIGSTLQMIRRYAALYNPGITDPKKQISVTDIGEVPEFTPPEPVARWRATTVNYCMSVRGRSGLVEIFLMPLADAISVGAEHHEHHPFAQFVLKNVGGQLGWCRDDMPVSADEVRRVFLQAFATFVREQSAPNELTQPIDLEKRNLAQRIVSQQEEVQRRIARDLHDAVIADVTLLKRSLLSDTPLSADETTQALDKITSRLREICYELSPSDLKDWGLKTTIEALLEQAAQRTGANCILNCNMEIPSLDSSIELHIFRILQESLNNAAKYSGATQMAVSVELKHGWLSFTVQDNGKGFDQTAEPTARTKDGGMGRTTMQERIELIRTLFPARLDIASVPGEGTTMTLFIKIRNQ
jgi:signal transduction histidine kinase